MSNVIDFYFDFISPYAYMANARLPKLAEQWGYAVNYLPINLNAAKLKAGNTGPATAQIPPKFRYAREDLQRWARRYGVPMKPPSRDTMPPNALDSTDAHKGVLFARHRGREAEFVNRVWHCVFGLRGWVGTRNTWIGVVDDMNWPLDTFLEFLNSDGAERQYREVNTAAQDRGVFGVPTMSIGDQMWWGNDRLFFMEEYLRGTSAQE